MSGSAVRAARAGPPAAGDAGARRVGRRPNARFSRNTERPNPFMVRKADGASGYASTDLATALYRTEHFPGA